MRRRFDAIVCAFLAVALLFLAVQIFPIAWGFYLGFTDSGPFVATPKFVGTANFAIIFADPALWSAVWKGALYAALSTLFQVAIGVGIAVMLFKHAGPLARSLTLLPYMIPVVTGALAWRWIADHLYGIFNYALMQSGLVSAPVDLATSPLLALPFVVFVSVWQFTPFVILVTLASLSTIPSSVYEAARVDGVNWWTELIYVTLPMLRAAILLIVLLRSIWMFNRFDVIWLLTGGGPRGATNTLPLYAYAQAFVENDYGTAGAVSVLIFGLLLVFGTTYLGVFKPEKEVVRA
jgi:multiple sugar transport system permease protein